MGWHHQYYVCLFFRCSMSSASWVTGAKRTGQNQDLCIIKWDCGFGSSGTLGRGAFGVRLPPKTNLWATCGSPFGTPLEGPGEPWSGVGADKSPLGHWLFYCKTLKLSSFCRREEMQCDLLRATADQRGLFWCANGVHVQVILRS